MAQEQDQELAYPPSWDTDVVLSDGRTVRIRPILPEDADGLRRFHDRQSPESIYFRYFSPRPELTDRDVEHFTHVDHDKRVAFIALSDGEIIAVARYERYQGSDVAEVAFFVDDDNHGRGLATLLLEYLAAAARERGIRRFTATTLPNNSKMLAVFSGAGYRVKTNFDSGVIEVGFDIAPTEDSVAAMERRERRAEAASVRFLLTPRSIAVIGAGRTHGSVGAEIYSNLRRHGFTGALHAVNRSGRTIDDLPALRSIMDLPDDTELAVIATPAADVLSDVERCGIKGIKSLVIVSAGFSESGPDGARLEKEVLEACRAHGMRLLGPNCLGIANTDPAVSMDASISAMMPPRGSIAVFSETGTLAAAMIEHALRTDMGVSSFVASGNRVDVTATDFLSYWVGDDDTDAVLLSLTAQDLVPRFVRAARATSLHKPVAALNTSGSIHGSRRRPDGLGRRARAMFRQTGVIGVSSLEQLFDLGRVLAEQPVPAGSRAAVVGNSDGALMLASGACRGAGLDLVDLGPLDLPEGSRTSPGVVDLTFRATADDFAHAMSAVAESGRVDALLVVYTPPSLEPDPGVNAAILEVGDRYRDLTLVATMFGSRDQKLLRGPTEGAASVPVFTFPEDAAYALGRLAAYRNWLTAAERSRQDGLDIEVVDAIRAFADRICGRGVDGDNGSIPGTSVRLGPAEQEELLGLVDVEIARRKVVEDVESAVRAAEEIGWPVVLKAATRDRTTRSVASGVSLDITDADHLRQEWARMTSAVGERMVPAVVQRFLANGVDLAVSISRDASGAGTVSVGIGGPGRLAGERELGILPLGLGDATTLVASSPVARVISDPLDRVPFIGMVHRLAQMAECLDVELELNADPVIVAGADISVVDIDMSFGDPLDDLSVRRLDDPAR